MSRKNRSRRRELPPSDERLGAVVGRALLQGIVWLIPALIALATFAAFEPALRNGFVDAWDDKLNLLDNPSYRGLAWPQLRWMFTTFHVGHYMPLTWVTLGLDYVLWGMEPFGYHLTSLVLHAANAVLLYFVARRLLQLALPGPAQHGQTALALGAGAAALLFALHPLRVESVAWATERRDVLSALFCLLTILAYLQFLRGEERAWGWYWTSLALFGCALLSKSMAVSMPVVLLILDVYPLRRLGGAAGWWNPRARRVYAEKLPFLALAGATSAIALVAVREADNMPPLDRLGVLPRLAISAYSLAFYLWKTVAPAHLSPLYELPATIQPWTWPFLLSYGALAAMIALALGLRRRLPGLAAAGLAYVVILLPVLGIFQNGPQIAADRYTYFSCLGWAILAGAGLAAGARRAPFVAAPVVACLLLALGTLTWSQSHVWRDSEKLWAHALAVDPGSALAHNNAGSTYATQGKLAEAAAHYEQAIRDRPDYAEAYENLGLVLARQGRLAGAIARYEQAVRLRPDYAKAHYNWAMALAAQGRLDEAGAHFRETVRIKPDFVLAHYNWAIALAQQGKLTEAIARYQEVLRIKPDFAFAHNNLGRAFAAQGRLDEAIAHYEQAVRFKPDFAEAHYNLGDALAGEGKLGEAIAHYEQAVRLKPLFAEAHHNLGIALTRQGRTAEANEHLQYSQRLKQ
jgi:tetratricopeptide (TPR) repeat protein